MKKKKKKGGGYNPLWLAILPVLVLLSIIAALELWNKFESTTTEIFGPEFSEPINNDNIFEIIERGY